MKILYTSKFEKSFKRLPKEIQNLAIQKEIIFREDIYDSKLRAHKLQGKLFEYYSFSVDYSYRIMFEILGNGDVIFLNIGGHAIYR